MQSWLEPYEVVPPLRLFPFIPALKRRGHFQRLFWHCVSFFIAVTRYHKLSGLKSHTFIISWFWRSIHNPTRLKSRCQQGCIPLEALRETLTPLPFAVSGAACISWLMAPSSILRVHRSSRCLWHHVASLCSQISLSPSPLKILGTAFTHNTQNIKCIGVFLTLVNPQHSGHHLGVFQPNSFLTLLELAQTPAAEGLIVLNNALTLDASCQCWVSRVPTLLSNLARKSGVPSTLAFQVW